MEHSAGFTIFWVIAYTLANFKRIEIIPSIVSDYNGIKLEVNNRNIAGVFKEYLNIEQHASK